MIGRADIHVDQAVDGIGIQGEGIAHRQAVARYIAGPGNVLAQSRAKGGTVAEVVERTLRLAARLYPTHDGIAGCLVLDGASSGADPEARSLAQAAQAEGAAALRAFIASEYPARAGELAELVTISLAGMSAAARGGAGQPALTRFAAAASRAFRREAAAPTVRRRPPPPPAR